MTLFDQLLPNRYAKLWAMSRIICEISYPIIISKHIIIINRRVTFSEVRNDTEDNHNFVRVLDPRAAEISFVRTSCPKRQAFYLSCSHLECGKQSVIASEQSLPKMSMPGRKIDY